MSASRWSQLRRVFPFLVLVFLGGCAQPQGEESAVSDTADDRRAAAELGSYFITELSPTGEEVSVEILPVDPPDGAPSCTTGTHLPAHSKLVRLGSDTLRIDPPLRERSALLRVLPGDSQFFNLTELRVDYPSVRAKRHGKARRVSITMSAYGCTWDNSRLLVLLEHVSGNWVARDSADFPGQNTVTAELDSLNSRFALGTN